MKWIRLMAVMMVVCASGDALAQRGHGLNFGNEESFPEEGVSFRVLRGAQSQPLPQPHVFHYRFETGHVEERFLARELWYPNAYRARWQDGSGNAMTFAVIGNTFPKAMPEGHITRAAYQEVMARAEVKPPANLDELVQWARDFVGAPIQGAPRAVPGTPRLQGVVELRFEGTRPARLGYAFQYRQNPHGVNPYQWYFMLFEVADAEELPSISRSIEQHFLRSLATVRKQEREAAQPLSLSQAAQLGERAASPEYMESRQRAINSIRGLSGWWYVETPNYVLVSDLSTGRRSFVQRLQTELERMRALYKEAVPPRKEISAVSLVRVFSDAADYKRYVGPAYEWTGGAWVPNRRELVIRSSSSGDERERRDRITSVVYHEAFHQYLFYAFDLMETSPWYNEGHAAFFEGADLRRDAVRITEVSEYAGRVDDLVSRNAVDLMTLLRLPYDAFYAEPGRRDHYALSWALIYYLRKGATMEQDNTYEQILTRYADALWSTRDARRATQQAFAGVDMDAFRTAFTSFWQSPARRHRAERNENW